ncbi:MAG TPA: S8 family serine peptidase, partial [Gemmataceae bacterium]|nr:S8 family serine peptidase [Gemmataceae bacterium]
MIVRLRAGEQALAKFADLDILSSGPHREQSYKYLQEDFQAAARPLADYLKKTREFTHGRYQSALAAYAAGKMDILSSESPIEHGVADYQELLPSRAIAVTATEDVFRQLRFLDAVKDVHPNYLYELPDLGPTEPGDPLDIQSAEDGDLLAWHLDHVKARGPNRRRAGTSVRVAVLDTGLDCTHREFRNRVSVPFAEWDALGTEVSAPVRRDTHGHGTHVTGILCGETVGVAPAVSVFIGLIAPAGRTTFAQVNKGLDWAARQGVHIVNISVGKKGYTGEMEQFTDFARQMNILIVAAVGNDGAGNHRSPGDYQSVLSVGATVASRQVWRDRYYASGGGLVCDGVATYRKPDVYAPGGDIYSSWSSPPRDDYQRSSGTSMAAPVVAGAAAVLKGAKMALTADELRLQILQNCEPIPLPPALGGTGLLLTGMKYVARDNIEQLAYQKYLGR